MDKDRDDGLRQALKAFSMLGGVGIYFVVFVGICVFLGYEADTAFGLGHAGETVFSLSLSKHKDWEVA